MELLDLNCSVFWILAMSIIRRLIVLEPAVTKMSYALKVSRCVNIIDFLHSHFETSDIIKYTNTTSWPECQLFIYCCVFQNLFTSLRHPCFEAEKKWVSAIRASPKVSSPRNTLFRIWGSYGLPKWLVYEGPVVAPGVVKCGPAEGFVPSGQNRTKSDRATSHPPWKSLNGTDFFFFQCFEPKSGPNCTNSAHNVLISARRRSIRLLPNCPSLVCEQRN